MGKTTRFLIFCLLGHPRQVGKTSLKKQAQLGKAYFDKPRFPGDLDTSEYFRGALEISLGCFSDVLRIC